jgi:hypothetical protein
MRKSYGGREPVGKGHRQQRRERPARAWENHHISQAPVQKGSWAETATNGALEEKYPTGTLGRRASFQRKIEEPLGNLWGN